MPSMSIFCRMQWGVNCDPILVLSGPPKNIFTFLIKTIDKPITIGYICDMIGQESGQTQK